jgi:hypothetical protein
MPSKREAVTPDMGFRQLEVRAASFNEEARTVEAVISTETPVEMPDWQRMEMVPEVLLASGADFPKSRQVPFLDSHNRSSVKDQLGSARDIKANKRDITSTLHFSKAPQGESALGDVRDGHITDVSVGYDVLKRTYIGKGDSKTLGGRTFTGPVNVVTKWRLREVSLTPIGADAQAKLRGLDPSAISFKNTDSVDDERSFEMNPELKALCVSRGMSAELSDDDAQRWLIDNADKLGKPEEKKEETRSDRGESPALTTEAIQKMIADATRGALDEAAKVRSAFEKEVASLCDLADMPEELAACRGLADIAAVREHIKAVKAKRSESIPYGGTVRHTGSGFDRLKTDIGAALTLKAVRQATGGNTAKMDHYLPADQRSKTADNFQHASLMDLAAEYVRANGVSTLGLTREEIAKCAMFGPKVAGIRSEGAYHNTGDFAALTLDAINKSLMIGYNEFPATWRGPMKQGDSVSDFKNINRMQIGAIENLPIWNDTDAPEKSSIADGKETYAVEARSIGVDFGYKLLVNDDMSALTSVPVKLGIASQRTVNAVAWSQVTSNPVLRDGKSLFLETPAGLRFRKNLTTGAGTPTVAIVGALKALMRQMRGENTPEGTESEAILNLTPSYLVVPSTLETTAEQLVNSVYDPAYAGGSTFNPTRTLQTVVEPILDANSATAWYLFANPMMVETVEVTFLAGQETPQVRTVMDEHTLAMTYYVLQSVGAKALDFRGIQKHAGA